MDANDAPEVDKMANPPEVVWDHSRDPEPYVPIYDLQTRQPQQPQQQYQQSSQQYQQTLPVSQAACPTTSYSPYGYVVGKSTSSDSGVDEKGLGSKRDATICGMSRALFITLVVLIVLIIGAAVGGGVGGSMAVKSAYNDGAKGASSMRPAADVAASSTNAVAAATTVASTTGTTSLYTAPTAGVQLALDCPQLAGEKVTIKYGSDYEASFNLACGLDKPGRGFDLFSATIYTYNDCMRLCVSYNRASHTKNCQGVSFGADLSDNVVRVYANCFLKNSTSDMTSTTDRFLFASLNS
ncbi:hypothetical protein PG997_002079 [Apiospora hydei]|uniref:Apple domain-containing protein n=1 Tax=Apiospora hydei TaxID=1337664 RepID=A0ABR1X8H3_9PEZI